MATTIARQHTALPMSYYREMVKDMDDSQKLELMAIHICCLIKVNETRNKE